MWLLNNLRIGVKLPVVMVLIGAVSLLVAELIAIKYTRETVLEAGAERLAAVAEARAAELHRTLASLRSDVLANLSNPVILEAARAFVHAYALSGPEGQEGLRRLYLTERPVPPVQGARAAEPGLTSSYALVHRRYHDFFNSRVQGRDFSDLFLVSPDGDVVYSVAKGPQFGRNVLKDRSLDPAMTQVFEAAASTGAPFSDATSDFEPDPSGARHRSALFAIPVRSPIGSLEAVLIKRVPIARIDQIMERPAGIGQTGQILLIGSDLVPRSSSASSASRSSALAGIEAEPAALGLSGQTGMMRHTDVSGRTLITAFAPVSVQNLHYAVLARQHEGEILSAADRVRSGMLNEGAIALAFVTVAGLALARSMSVPLTRVGEAMAQVGSGKFDTTIPDRLRRDEIGGIARRLDAFRASLLVAEGTKRENAFKGAAFQSTAAALMIVDCDLTIIHVNAAMVDLVTRNRVSIDRLVPDFRPEAMSGRNLTVFFPGAATLLDDRSGTSERTAEIRFGQRHFRLAISVVLDPDKSHLGYVVECSDVTDLRLNEVLLDVISDRFPIAGFSPDGRVVSANPLFEKFIGIEPGGLAGRGWDWLFWRDENREGPPASGPWSVVSALPPGSPIVLVPPRRRAGPVPASLSEVRDSAGVPQRYVLIVSAETSVARIGKVVSVDAELAGTAKCR